MKASTPSLLLFCITSVLAIIPSLFIYYLVNNNYKISFYKIIIFLVLFIRDVLVVLKLKETAFGSFICVLFVYVLLFYVAIQDLKKIKFNKNDIATILVIIFGIGAVCYSVLNLKLENLDLNFSLYVLFGVVLSLLSIFSILNYVKIGNNAFFNALLMCVCFIISDVFFVISRFYYFNQVFAITSLITQFLSYFFMTNYFLDKDKMYDDLAT